MGEAAMILPGTDEYPAAFHGYVTLVPETDVLAALEAQLGEVRRLAALVPPGRESFAYAPGKWSIRQILGHLGDGERVFGFRAFTFGRGDRAALPGFDENAYVASARSAEIPLRDLVDEFGYLREGNLRMLRGLAPGQWSNSGTANDNAITVRALIYAMAGHVRHHLGVLKERYGVD